MPTFILASVENRKASFKYFPKMWNYSFKHPPQQWLQVVSACRTSDLSTVRDPWPLPNLMPCASLPTHCTAVNETPKSIAAAHRIVKPPGLRSTLWFPNTQNTFPFNFCEGLLWQSNKTQRSRGMKRSFIINRILAHIKVND